MDRYARSRIVGDVVIPLLVIVVGSLAAYVVYDWTMRVELEPSAAPPAAGSIVAPLTGERPAEDE
jgi:hypothetical protein